MESNQPSSWDQILIKSARENESLLFISESAKINLALEGKWAFGSTFDKFSKGWIVPTNHPNYGTFLSKYRTRESFDNFLNAIDQNYQIWWRIYNKDAPFIPIRDRIYLHIPDRETAKSVEACWDEYTKNYCVSKNHTKILALVQTYNTNTNIELWRLRQEVLQNLAISDSLKFARLREKYGIPKLMNGKVKVISPKQHKPGEKGNGAPKLAKLCHLILGQLIAIHKIDKKMRKESIFDEVVWELRLAAIEASRTTVKKHVKESFKSTPDIWD